MFACIYSRSLAEWRQKRADTSAETDSPLVDLAFTFSPLVEQKSADTVVLDVSGQDLLFGSPNGSSDQVASCVNKAHEIFRQSTVAGLKVNVAVAANVDVAIHAARLIEGVTVIPAGDETLVIGPLSIKQIDHSLAAIEEKRAAEIQETFALWGLRTFGDLARLPLAGVAERLGQEGVRLQKLAQGKSDRRLNLICPPVGFAQSLELEHAISEVEPLSFILSRLLNQLCANLNEYALATNELQLAMKLQTKAMHERTLTLPVPMRNHRTLLRLLLFDIEREPPPAPIIAVVITAKPVEPRASQTGLFIPLAPEPEKLEITLARLVKLVGVENVGSPEMLDTHRPDAFRMNRFNLNHRRRRKQPSERNPRSNQQSAIGNRQSVMGFRMFRPAWLAEVKTSNGQPIYIAARAKSFGKLSGRIVRASGPWRGSGDWWRADVWARDEWDMAVIDPKSSEGEVLCRVYRDLTTEQWFVEGVYD